MSVPGLGQELKRRGEMVLIERAIRQGWDITPKGRADALSLISEVLDDPQATGREKLRACSVAIAMDTQNLEDEEEAALFEHAALVGRLLELEARAQR
jgi:hypothetical protein